MSGEKLRNSSEKVEKYLVKVEKKKVYLMAWAWAGSCGCDGVQRCQRWGKQNERSCLRLAPTSGEAVAAQSVSAQGMCTHTVSMLTQDAHNLDAHIPLLQEPCVPESYDDVQAPCLWKREEA